MRRKRRFFGGGRRRSGVGQAKYKRAFLIGAVIMIFIMMGMPKVSAAIQSKMRAWFPKLVF